MRAREFVSNEVNEGSTITIPITITIPTDDRDPVVNVIPTEDPTAVTPTDTSQPAADPQELEQDPMMVPPLQQEVEMDKASLGKKSPVIDKLTQDEAAVDDESELPLSYR